MRRRRLFRTDGVVGAVQTGPGSAAGGSSLEVLLAECHDLYSGGHPVEALGRLNRIAVALPGSASPAVASALAFKGRILGELGRVAEAQAAFGALTEQFGAGSDAAVRGHVLAGMCDHARLLSERGRHAEAAAVASALIARSVDGASPSDIP
ncbi:MAG: hypothetical protein QOG70_1631, partial [Solirubrobacteraceae bacterium]|nr:hypothetical protein [Solirubrobacteraceae bacterium]